MDNIMPVLEVKARRVGGATYQVPIEVRPDRRQALGLKMACNLRHARERNEKTMEGKTGKPNSLTLSNGNTRIRS